jgi:hypothetical protein
MKVSHCPGQVALQYVFPTVMVTLDTLITTTILGNGTHDAGTNQHQDTKP